MKYLIATRTQYGRRTYAAIGNRDALMDAAYEAGALGVTVKVLA